MHVCANMTVCMNVLRSTSLAHDFGHSSILTMYDYCYAPGWAQGGLT
jgi:hypothetical protein